MTTRELMSGGVVTVHGETSVLAARDLMTRERIRHLPVVDARGGLVGIVTDRDIRLNLPSQATSLSAQESNYLLSRLGVAQIMTRPVITTGPDRPAAEVAQLMLEHRIGAVPIVEGDRLVGIVTDTDVVRAFARIAAPSSGLRS